MPLFRNISPLGDLDVPLVRRVVAAGEVIDIPAEKAVFVAAQSENWAPEDDDARALVAGLLDTAEADQPAPAAPAPEAPAADVPGTVENGVAEVSAQ